MRTSKSNHAQFAPDRLVGNPASAPQNSAAQESTAHNSFVSRFFKWVEQDPRRMAERRGQHRVADPPLRAYLGVFGSTEPFPVGNISATGFFLVTPDRWLPGTNMPLRLERTDKPGFAALHCVSVSTRVVRSTSAGVGFAFVLKDEIVAPTPKSSSFTEPEGGWRGPRWADREAIEDLVSELGTAQSASPKRR
ncbi:MAG TPA: PilZ domain-containing protein [Terracidiphilus sp.]|nr:PilZ domain-containing protein [Terracidiphilus sp.]